MRSPRPGATGDDWAGAIDEATGLNYPSMQFIGGEQTLQPSLPLLVRHALRCGMTVEVFSKLMKVTPPCESKP